MRSLSSKRLERRCDALNCLRHLISRHPVNSHCDLTALGLEVVTTACNEFRFVQTMIRALTRTHCECVIARAGRFRFPPGALEQAMTVNSQFGKHCAAKHERI